MDLRNDFQQRSTTTVSSAEKDGKAPTLEEWLREAEELERRVLLTQQSIVANKKKETLQHKTVQRVHTSVKIAQGGTNSAYQRSHFTTSSNNQKPRLIDFPECFKVDSHPGTCTRNKNGRV